ncbi:MAG: hypothetical protein JNJ65_16185 [Cyclobacteriaceae bacterium]|nr:hypothetical protein [Cyclobacteriaceae bacterium]
MKKITSLLLLVLAACGANSVQQDLITYINVEMDKVAELEAKAVEAYASVSGENYQNDSIMYAVISETVVPTYEEFYNTLSAIKPATEEVAALHKEYVRAAADQMEAFKLILEAIEKQDVAIIDQANEDLDEARALLRLWREDLDSACVKHNVVFEEN